MIKIIEDFIKLLADKILREVFKFNSQHYFNTINNFSTSGQTRKS